MSQGNVIAGLNKRKGLIGSNETRDGYSYCEAEVPLAEMFGYVGDLRSNTQGKGEFTMEFKQYNAVMMDKQKELEKAYLEERTAKKK